MCSRDVSCLKAFVRGEGATCETLWVHLHLGIIIYCKTDPNLKYLEEDLLLQDGIQAGGNVCPMASLWCTGVPIVWWERLFWLEGGELLCLTWDGQEKMPDTGHWRAGILMKMCSWSLERPLNLKGVGNYFVFSNTCLEPKDWLRSLVWRPFSENYDLLFWMTETIE